MIERQRRTSSQKPWGMGHGDVLCVRITHGTHPGIPEGGRGAVKEGDDVLSRRVIWRGGAQTARTTKNKWDGRKLRLL